MSFCGKGGDGPRTPAIVTAKKGRRLRDERTVAQVVGGPPRAERAGEHQPNPPTIAGKSAIVSVRDRPCSASASSSRWRS